MPDIIQSHHSKFKVGLIPAFEDNYLFVLFDTETHQALVIDPGEAEPVARFLQENGLTLVSILLTHHHWDHVGGVDELMSLYPQCELIAPLKNKDQFKAASQWLSGGESIEALGVSIDVIAVPGHTLGHLAFYLPQAQILFCGDTLFSFGCGRLFEGTAEMMWESLKKLRALPDETMVFCAHEYTLSNLRFVRSLDPENQRIKELQKLNIGKRENSEPTIPFSLGEQKRFNPFLRADDPELAQRLNCQNQPSATVFANLRSAKDRF